MEKKMILALDISTRVTGVCFLKNDGEIYHCSYILTETSKKSKAKNPKKIKPKELDFKDMFDKIDYIITYFKKFHILNPNAPKVTKIHIEEPLSKFTPGKSTAETIQKLSQINYAISYELYKMYDLKPEYHHPSTVRKNVGLKIPKGSDTKALVFEYAQKLFPKFKDMIPAGLPQKHPWVDVADAVLIAYSAYHAPINKID